MRLAIVVAAISFAAGGALTTLAILLDGAAGGRISARPASFRDGVTGSAHANPRVLDDESLPGWSPGSASVELLLTGVNYHWEVRYPRLTGAAISSSKPESAVPRKIHLPANTNVRIRLQSRDYVYLLRAPNAGGGPGEKSQITVPNLPFTLDFKTGPQGILLLSGDHLCGLSRPTLDILAVVQSQEEFQAWMVDQRK